MTQATPSALHYLARHFVGASSLGIGAMALAASLFFASGLRAAEDGVWEAHEDHGCKPGMLIVLRRAEGKLSGEVRMTDPSDSKKVWDYKWVMKDIVEKSNTISFDTDTPAELKNVPAAKGESMSLKFSESLSGKTAIAEIVGYPDRKLAFTKKEK